MIDKVSKAEERVKTSVGMRPSIKKLLLQYTADTGMQQNEIIEEGILLLAELRRAESDPVSVAKQIALQRSKSSIESLISAKLNDREREALTDLLTGQDDRSTERRQALVEYVQGAVRRHRVYAKRGN